MMKRILLIAMLELAALAAGAQVYVATDKACYVAGESIHCSVFCAPGPSVAYLELISTDGPAARTRIDVRGGRGGGSMSIPIDTPTGNYRLFAYSCPEDAAYGGPLLSVFNTASVARVSDGVVIVSPDAYGTPSDAPAGYGLYAAATGRIVLENTSGEPVSCCVSLTRSDSIQAPEYRSIASFVPGSPKQEEQGELIRAVLAGPDAGRVDAGSVSALLAVPGAKTDCYSALPSEDGTFSFITENIFGSGDIVCMPDGLEPGVECHLELVSPFLSPSASALPRLRLCRSMEADLVRRSAAVAGDRAADTLITTLPMRREHFMLTHECIPYILDDYTRFPTMEEVFVEITPEVKLRRPGGQTQIFVLRGPSVRGGSPHWGKAAVMIDGVPVPDHKLIETYDASLVKTVEVYPYRYSMGYKVFDGVVNLVTFQGNMPGLLFDDNVRIYDFQGCAWPAAYSGRETPFWHPLVSLQPGEKLEIPSQSLEPGVPYILKAEGLTADGRPVYLRKTIVR